jgi:PhzF family phenazine biosynthesis protein
MSTRDDAAMTDPTVLRLAAFTDRPEGGNPAGVVLDAAGLSDADMQAVATDVGYSETAFVTGSRGARELDVRYFSPLAEVPFCGHATIATGVALAERDGPGAFVLHTQAGEVVVDTACDGGRATATLTSVAPHVEIPGEADVDAALELLGWTRADLDPALPPRVAYAGARHLVLAADSRARLADLDYDFEGLKAYMLERDLTTVDLVWREGATTFHARNPFPVGGVVEDPATGAAAAAFGAYLRDLGAVTPPARVTIRQGEDMGRASLLLVDIDAAPAGIRVGGGAVAIDG